ncbi:MAG: alpha/beta hydrolase fold protein, partial [Thermomicrobiales bacterium]|nr:alpha/beta hydrolase fold protein [Thermomicrobiales bacterium]
MIAIQQPKAVQWDTPVDSVKFVELPTGVRLSYVEQGDPAGVPVVLLHGVTDSWRSFEPVLPYLPRSIRAFALTLRGHGDASRPAPGYRPRGFAADVAAFLDGQGLESTVIAGHSMGSTVALRFALDYPERTRGLVPMGTFVRYRTNPVISEFWETVVSGLEDPIDRSIAREFQESTLAGPISPSFLETAIAESLKVPARVWRDAFAGLLEDEHVGRLESIAAPTLLIWGDHDAFVPESDQETLLATIVGSRLETYSGTGHAVHWEEPARFAADLTAFVDGLSGPPDFPLSQRHERIQRTQREDSTMSMQSAVLDAPSLTSQSLRRITVDDTELEYEVCGSGEPVLLIHGGILAEAFAPLLDVTALTERYRVISYHRRGFAGSARPHGEVSIARQAADARAVLAHLGIARAHVVAHSYAGAIALQLALDTPAAVHSLALLEPALFSVPSGEQFIAAVFGSAIERYGAGDRAGAVATVLRGVAGAAGFAAVQRALPGALELAEVDADTFFQTELPALQAWRFASEEARRIEQPLLVVRGADSDAVAPVFGEGIAMLQHWLPRAETFVVPEATHGMPFMNPCALAEGLTAFFARHSLPSRIRQSEDAVAHRARTRDQRETPSGINGAGANRDLPSISTASSVTQEASSVAGHQPVGPIKIMALYGPPDDPAAFERHYAET